MLTMEGPEYRPGTILVEDGRIVALGADLAIPPEARVLDARGLCVLPGLVEAHCHLGLAEEGVRFEGDDVNEVSDPVTPQLRALDGINPRDEGFRDALAGGVTTVFVTPGSANVIGGQGAVLKTCGLVVDRMVVREPAGMKIAFGENPKWNYGWRKKAPVTRMATAALLRQELARAADYRRKREKGEEVDRDLKLEALALVLSGRIPLRAHAHRADDMLTALRIAREFGVGVVLEHCTEGHLIAAELAEGRVPCVVGPALSSRSKVELREMRFATAAALASAGVPVALTTDHPVVPIQYLRLCAALAAGEGMPRERALAAVTIAAARILGVDDRVGSLAPGKDADLVLLRGDPLDPTSRVELVLVNGETVYRREAA